MKYFHSYIANLSKDASCSTRIVYCVYGWMPTKEANPVVDITFWSLTLLTSKASLLLIEWRSRSYLHPTKTYFLNGVSTRYAHVSSIKLLICYLQFYVWKSYKSGWMYQNTHNSWSILSTTKVRKAKTIKGSLKGTIVRILNNRAIN